METTEKIVEAYLRYVRKCATIPNISCGGQFEIDLLAINLVTCRRYHVESGVSISGVFGELTDKPFSGEALKQRTQAAGQRRTISYFAERKFARQEIVRTLSNYGFHDGEYSKVIVSWGWTAGAAAQAAERGIELWDFRDILREMVNQIQNSRQYFTDDTLRTLHLFGLASGDGPSA